MASWLDDLKTKVLGAPPGVHLGAFGKHPGWDDHVEPIGLDSEPLVAARQIFYVNGIGGVIDTALWDKRPEETLPQIAHLFCWTSETDTLIGRMWSSTDGKGRSKYPMAAVAHIGLPFSYLQAVRAARVLSGVETHCRQASTGPEVRAVFASGLEELRAALAQPADGLGAELDRDACTRVANEMRLNEDSTFARTLYALDQKVRSFGFAQKASPGKISLKMLDADDAAQQTRLPMAGTDSIEGVAFWHKAIMGFAPVKKPLLFIHPIDHRWVDVILGTPTARQLYCIRANETAMPLVSAVPYELEPDFRASADEFIGKICDVATGAPVTPKPAGDTPPPLPTAADSVSLPPLPF